jgi:hypothetical protein
MGIDIYTRWDGQTEEEKWAQITGFSVVSGHVGYLREAYHGGPYMTQFLLAEAFNPDSEDEYGAVEIPAQVLRQRLEQACEILKERSMKVYKQPASPEELQSLADFVALVDRLEREGKKPRIVASY